MSDSEPRKGLILDVLRPADGRDCTNGGISARTTMVTVTGVREGTTTRPGCEVRLLPETHRVFAPSERAPEVTLVIRDNGRGRKYLSLEPVYSHDPVGAVHYMAGGNFASSHDSRWAALTGDGRPVSIHDRTETGEQYRRLSY